MMINSEDRKYIFVETSTHMIQPYNVKLLFGKIFFKVKENVRRVKHE